MKQCPRCKRMYNGHSAISRRDNVTKICEECGLDEAVLAAGLTPAQLTELKRTIAEMKRKNYAEDSDDEA